MPKKISNWPDAVQIMSSEHGYGQNARRLEAARWMVRKLNTYGDPDGIMDWLLEGDWEGNEAQTDIQGQIRLISEV